MASNMAASTASKMAPTNNLATLQQQQLNNSTSKSESQQRLCVIGAGAAGLCMARHFKEPPQDGSQPFHVTVFEQGTEVGGTWVYVEATGLDQLGLPVHSSMYENLRTNGPKESMGFLDYPFWEGGRSFIKHHHVLRYLQDYCRHFEIAPLIQFCTKVNRVSPLHRDEDKTSSPIGYEVEVEDVITKQKEICTFDAVAVCNGRYSMPRFPSLDGLDTFLGDSLHSHDYRHPEPFAGKVVACLGSGPSGIDIALELASTASEVLLCHRSQLIKSPLPANVRQMPWPDRCCSTGLQFAGTAKTVPVDTLVLCTGYYYSFPFLEGKAKVAATDNQVEPLYKHFLHTRCFPSLVVLSFPFGALSFLVFHVQALIFRMLLECKLQLPAAIATGSDVNTAEAIEAATRAEMAEFVAGGGQHRHFHRMRVDRLTKYLDELTTWAGLEPVPRAILDCHRKAGYLRSANLSTYRKANFRLTDTEAVERELTASLD